MAEGKDSSAGERDVGGVGGGEQGRKDVKGNINIYTYRKRFKLYIYNAAVAGVS